MEYFVDTSKLKYKQVMPTATMRSIWGKQLMVNIIDSAPHSQIAMHSHPHEQAGYIIQGEVEMTIDGKTARLGPGDAYLIPSRVEHSLRGLDGWAHFLDIFSPPRDDYMK